jgi:hypothetical protein
LVLSSFGPKPVGAVEKILLIDGVEQINRHFLHEFVFQGGDGQRELHTTPASLWAGPRSVILSIHSAVRASLYLRSDL